MNIIKKLLGKSKESSGNNDSSSHIIDVHEGPDFKYEEYKYPTLDLLKQRDDNKKPGVIPMYSLLNSKEFQNSQYKLPCAMGLKTTGEPFIFDLQKAPHLLIAGTNDHEKSVALDVIITSLIYKKHHRDLKFVFIDQTGTKFLPYQSLYGHFLASFRFMSLEQIEKSTIIQKSYDIIDAFKSLLMMMNKRYDLFKDANTANIIEYNKKFDEGKIIARNGNWRMPYIVVVVNELEEIMRNHFENTLLLSKLLQLSGAAGIHLIISTVHISENVLQSEIKTKLPFRIAFRTSSMEESKIILETPGAEKLRGSGDMIYKGSQVTSVQCAIIEPDETERICKYIKDQKDPGSYYNLPFDLSAYVEPPAKESDYINDVNMTYIHPKFADAAKIIVESQNGSSVFLQQEVRVGPYCAEILLDQLNKAGIVGPAFGARPRSVLVSSMEELEKILKQYPITYNMIL